MNIAYFPLQAAQNSHSVLNAILDCLKSAGHSLIENSMHADVAIIWSVLWNGRMARNQAVYTHYRSQGKPVICIDIGSLQRGITWKIALNNINADGYYGHLENLDWDRPRQLGIKLSSIINSSPQIVIAAQHNKSLQVNKLSSLESWITEKINQLRTSTDRPIVIRPHPRCKLQFKNLDSNIHIDHPQKIINSYDSFNMQFNCHAMVNYNSGPGIQAAIHGCRPIVDKSSLAYPVSINVEDIEKPYTVDRDKWLVEICHTEYTLDEISKGIWVKRLNLAL